VEYNRLLVEPGLQQQFLERILEIAFCDARWDRFHLDGFTQDDMSPLLLNEPTFSVSTETSHFFDLKLTREQSLDVISQLRGSTRKQIRRNNKAYDKIETEWAQDIDHAISIFSDLLQLHQARWNGIGKPGVFSSERFTQFHIDLIKKLIPLKRVALFRVTNDGDVVGCVYMLIDANRALCYSTGTAPYEGRLSPGVHCCYLCIEECLHQGLDAFDFMCGEMYYKKSLSTNSTNLVWATYRRRRIRFVLVKTIRSFKRFMNSMRRVEDSLE
jgi:CelD/BcsL family acetyltransferase involved in cellulose biosynthesis